jgi:Protein of unknown function (DUF2877)
MSIAKRRANNHIVAFNCECIGELHKYLHKSTVQENLVGKVISAFPSSLNVKTSRNELLVISLNKIQSPITINLSPQSSNSNFAGLVNYGYDVIDSRNSISVGERMKFHTEKSIVYKNCFVRPTCAGLYKFIYAAEKILSTLMELRRNGCMLEPDLTNQGLLHKFVTDTSLNIIKNKDNTRFVRTLSNSLMKMCGRGPGFTPSGDDFICGFSSLFNLLCQNLEYPSISLPMKRVCDLTTWISFKFIYYYQKLIVDEQIQGLINSIGEGRTDRFIYLLSTLGYRGHTSGIDIATGLSTAIFTFGDRFLGTELLPKVQGLLEYGNQQKG